jgi:hypothetical protein
MSESACNWPHAWMTAEEERALEEAIALYRPFMEAMARRVARGEKALASDLVQESLVLLWRWGTARVATTEQRVVRGAIVKEMLEVRRAERRKSGGALRVSLRRSASP